MVKIICVSPNLGYSEIYKSNPRAVIMTSGTLKPISNLEQNLQIKF